MEVLASSAQFLYPADSKHQPFWQIPGMPPRRLLKLAEQLEEIASKLERVELHPFINNSLVPYSAQDAREFKELPDVLRKRALFLTLQVGTNKTAYSIINREMEKVARIKLLEFVRQSSSNHKPMYAQVALLLSAALYAVGRDRVVTPESLRTLWHEDQSLEKSSENLT